MPLMPAADFDRRAALRRLADESFDVLVVGGGVTGCGVALDAVSRGLRTALVERADFASGTSSKSSKLVHGGLRYLQQREFRLVYEALHERQRLRHLAPHLVRVLPFLLPMFSRDGFLNPKLARALGTTMWMYDLTGGARIGKLHERLTTEQALAYMPTLPADRVASAYLYYDARTDDARLTLALARTAADLGATVANYAAVVAFPTGPEGRIRGATVEVDGERFDVSASVVVNATGVWADRVAALDGGTPGGWIRPAKGIHITVPWSKVRNEIAAVVPVPKDRRSVFVVPWGEHTFIGTTDTDYDGPLEDPQCTPDDIAYLLRAANFSITGGIGEADIVGTWAGLRPLVRDASSERTADMSRRHAVSRSAGGLITVAGGKLTTYRRMAADAVDEVAETLGKRSRSRTARLRLLGAEGHVEPAGEGLDAHLAGRYGGEARVLRAMIDGDADLGRTLVPGLPYVRAEARFAVRYEMARSLDDVLARRTRARLLGRDASSAAAEQVARFIAPDLGWSPAEVARQVSRYRASIDAERRAGGLPETALDAALGA
jgi:glycerol-3-phosphate dehydrogenase